MLLLKYHHFINFVWIKMLQTSSHPNDGCSSVKNNRDIHKNNIYSHILNTNHNQPEKVGAISCDILAQALLGIFKTCAYRRDDLEMRASLRGFCSTASVGWLKKHRHMEAKVDIGDIADKWWLVDDYRKFYYRICI